MQPPGRTAWASADAAPMQERDRIETLLSSRQGRCAPGQQRQPRRNGTWRGHACQRTRRSRQLREDRSRGTVRTVGRKGLNLRHDGEEDARAEAQRRRDPRRAQHGRVRAAGRAGAARVLAGVAGLGSGRRRRHGVRVPIGDSRWVVVPMLMTRSDRTAVVIGTAEPQGRGGSALQGHRQHQQPGQQRSQDQAHVVTPTLRKRQRHFSARCARTRTRRRPRSPGSRPWARSGLGGSAC